MSLVCPNRELVWDKRATIACGLPLNEGIASAPSHNGQRKFELSKLQMILAAPRQPRPASPALGGGLIWIGRSQQRSSLRSGRDPRFTHHYLFASSNFEPGLLSIEQVGRTIRLLGEFVEARCSFFLLPNQCSPPISPVGRISSRPARCCLMGVLTTRCHAAIGSLCIKHLVRERAR